MRPKRSNITKPFDQGEILARVRDQLEIRQLTGKVLAANRELRAPGAQ
jgi:DNA-binding response OmpR family regulator